MNLCKGKNGHKRRGATGKLETQGKIAPEALLIIPNP